MLLRRLPSITDIGQIAAYNKNILVDAVRDLEKEANFRPYEAKARFFIIDDADKMIDAASNAGAKVVFSDVNDDTIELFEMLGLTNHVTVN